MISWRGGLSHEIIKAKFARLSLEQPDRHNPLRYFSQPDDVRLDVLLGRSPSPAAAAPVVLDCLFARSAERAATGSLSMCDPLRASGRRQAPVVHGETHGHANVSRITVPAPNPQA